MDLSIIIPAYNEEKRLPQFLEQVISYCNNSKRKSEIIVVDDGSADKTEAVVISYAKRFKNLQLVKIDRNHGKGYAVKRGMLKATGELRVFMDADGSVQPDEIDKNIHYLLKQGYDIFVGSRVLKDKGQTLEVKWYRKLIGKVFNSFVQFFLFKNISDTQCGFKMFKKDVIVPLFSRIYLNGFGFDIEALYLGHKMGYRIIESPVSWRHRSGSKINVLTDPIKMFVNILQVRNWHCVPINTSDKYMGPDEYRYMYNMENYHWWFISHRRLALSLMNPIRSESPAILDVGSGTGRTLLSLNKIGDAHGVDVSDRAVSFCKERGITNVLRSTAEKMDYKDSRFDIVTCLDILEHVSDPIEVLHECKRVMRDNGKMVITVPAFAFLWSQHDEALCHFRRYDKVSLCADLHESGFKIERLGYFFFISFLVVAPIRLLRRMVVSGKKPHSDTTTLPPKILNEFLRFWFTIEIKLLDRIKFPFGTTLFAVVSKKR
ncbi:glycosyltransferase [Candidatus Omnitrophota bacterium]